jgi:hypothetical protein
MLFISRTSALFFLSVLDDNNNTYNRESRVQSSSGTATNSYSVAERSFAVFTSNLAGSGASLTVPHLSTESRINPLNISTLALRRIIVLPGLATSICAVEAKSKKKKEDTD